MKRHPSSFRDPAGFIFKDDGKLYRQVNKVFKSDFESLHSSGLYDELVDKALLIPHEANGPVSSPGEHYATILPKQLDFISYPYEWSFSQLKDAALVTLRLQKLALSRGMSLKDASAYNIQFVGGQPQLIDTLSLENYAEGTPWVAYRQFCQHFLAPLALMAYTDVRINSLLESNIDGIPLPLASALLPMRTKLKFSILIHLHLHARAQIKNADLDISKNHKKANFRKRSLLGLLDSLKSCIEGLHWSPSGTEWHDYYQSNNNYEEESFNHKGEVVEQWLSQNNCSSVWDLGANTGRFSQIAAKYADHVVAWDVDPGCVEQNYLNLKKSKDRKILPLYQDLTSPSPSIGWANQERDSFSERANVDMILALGLVHHLAISNNLPLGMLADYFSSMSEYSIIEFVPKDDSQVKKLLRTRKDIFDSYNEDRFVQEFSKVYEIIEKKVVSGTLRTLYLMKSKKLETRVCNLKA